MTRILIVISLRPFLLLIILGFVDTPSRRRRRQNPTRVYQRLINQVRVLTNILEQLLPLILLFHPLDNVIVGLLVLQASENGLVLHRDLEELSLACVTVQGPFGRTRSCQPISSGHHRQLNAVIIASHL